MRWTQGGDSFGAHPRVRRVEVRHPKYDLPPRGASTAGEAVVALQCVERGDGQIERTQFHFHVVGGSVLGRPKRLREADEVAVEPERTRKVLGVDVEQMIRERGANGGLGPPLYGESSGEPHGIALGVRDPRAVD